MHKGSQVFPSRLSPCDIKNLRRCEEVMCFVPHFWHVASVLKVECWGLGLPQPSCYLGDSGWGQLRERMEETWSCCLVLWEAPSRGDFNYLQPYVCMASVLHPQPPSQALNRGCTLTLLLMLPGPASEILIELVRGAAGHETVENSPGDANKQPGLGTTVLTVSHLFSFGSLRFYLRQWVPTSVPFLFY